MPSADNRRRAPAATVCSACAPSASLSRMSVDSLARSTRQSIRRRRRALARRESGARCRAPPGVGTQPTHRLEIPTPSASKRMVRRRGAWSSTLDADRQPCIHSDIEPSAQVAPGRAQCPASGRSNDGWSNSDRSRESGREPVGGERGIGKTQEAAIETCLRQYDPFNRKRPGAATLVVGVSRVRRWLHPGAPPLTPSAEAASGGGRGIAGRPSSASNFSFINNNLLL